MKFQPDVDDGVFELSTGTRFSSVSGVLGIREGDTAICEGQDGTVFPEDDDGFARSFTPEERREIAQYMMQLWWSWAATGKAFLADPGGG